MARATWRGGQQIHERKLLRRLMLWTNRSVLAVSHCSTRVVFSFLVSEWLVSDLSWLKISWNFQTMCNMFMLRFFAAAVAFECYKTCERDVRCNKCYFVLALRRLRCKMSFKLSTTEIDHYASALWSAHMRQRNLHEWKTVGLYVKKRQGAGYSLTMWGVEANDLHRFHVHCLIFDSWVKCLQDWEQ